MTTIYLMRHAESVANVGEILAGRTDFALSEDGKADALALAQAFSERFSIDAIWCSPLLRAQQTAAPFLTRCDAPFRFDDRLMEQHLGRFSGMTYQQAEADAGYCRDRTARWQWVPEGGGESYEMIATRVQSFLDDFVAESRRLRLGHVLVVTHAVTLRLFRACLEKTLPKYPEKIAANGEIWRVDLDQPSPAKPIDQIMLSQPLRAHRA